MTGPETYSEEAILAVERTGKAWLMAAHAMRGAKLVAALRNPNNAAITAESALEASAECAKAFMEASGYADAAWSGRGREAANKAAGAACDADDIARTAAWWAANPEGVATGAPVDDDAAAAEEGRRIRAENARANLKAYGELQ